MTLFRGNSARFDGEVGKLTKKNNEHSHLSHRFSPQPVTQISIFCNIYS